MVMVYWLALSRVFENALGSHPRRTSQLFTVHRDARRRASTQRFV
jgi:hypothetical protein